MPKARTDAVFDFKPFDDEEGVLIESVERGEWSSIMTPQSKAELEKIAKNTLAIQIRVSEQELSQIQSKATQAGISSDVLIHTIIHKYLSGELIEASSQ